MYSRILDDKEKQNKIFKIAAFMISSRCTIRDAAAKFNIPKSTIYDYMTKNLPKLSPLLHRHILKILSYNKEVRLIRATQASKVRLLERKRNNECM